MLPNSFRYERQRPQPDLVASQAEALDVGVAFGCKLFDGGV